jgi:hypothetical protein
MKFYPGGWYRGWRPGCVASRDVTFQGLLQRKRQGIGKDFGVDLKGQKSVARGERFLL